MRLGKQAHTIPNKTSGTIGGVCLAGPLLPSIAVNLKVFVYYVRLFIIALQSLGWLWSGCNAASPYPRYPKAPGNQAQTSHRFSPQFHPLTVQIQIHSLT